MLLLLLAPSAWAQSALDMASAPRHRLLLANDRYPCSRSVSPTERAMARQDHNCRMARSSWGRRVGVSTSEDAPSAYANERTSEYCGVTVEFLNPRVTNHGYPSSKDSWDNVDMAMNPPGDAHTRFVTTLNLGAATVSDIQLLSRDPIPAPEKDGPELLIPATDIDLKAGERERIRKSSGQAVSIPAARKSTPVSAATDPARLVLVQFKMAAGN